MKIETAHTPFGDMVFYTTHEKAHKFRNHFEQNTWEPDVAHIIANHPAFLFVDVGAGFGYYSLMAGDNSWRRVVAVEPHPIRYGMMVWNLRNLLDYTTHNTAVGTSAYFDLHEPVHMGYPEGRHYLTPLTGYLPLSRLIDSYSKALVKIDVEGAEVAVIKSLGNLDNYHGRVEFIIEYHTNWKHVNTCADDIKRLFPPPWQHAELGKRSHVIVW